MQKTMPHLFFSSLYISKMEEIYAPSIEEMVFITDSAYNKQEVIKYIVPCTFYFLCTQFFSRFVIKISTKHLEITTSIVKSF